MTTTCQRMTMLVSLILFGLAACQDAPASTPQDVVDPPQPPVPENAAEESLTWTPEDNTQECNVDALIPPHVGVRRVKNILTGMAPTSAEVESVQKSPDNLRNHVTQWIETPEFKNKLQAFLTVTLQQAQAGRNDYVTQVSNAEEIAGFGAPDSLWQSLNESFVRTAMAIVDEERPFHEIASTRTWMMTTAMMAYLIHADRLSGPSMTFYHNPTTINGINFDSNTPLNVQLANGVIYSTAPLTHTDSGCSDPYEVVFRNRSIPRLKRTTFTTFINGRAPNTVSYCQSIRTRVFQNSDFTDWRPVTISTMAPNTARTEEFYNAPALRQMNTLALAIPRAGFYTTPSFLAGWRTNEDNSFRVTTNQTLITALGLAFEDTDTTTPLGDDGLANDHAAPNTQCYSCHKNLDPMRNFFDVMFQPDTYAPRLAADRLDVEPSFSFQGYSQPGSDLAALGEILGGHPYFATGWTQKLCMYANSQRCDEDNPEFARIVTAFKDSNYNLKTLLIELFSSSLVTGFTCSPGDENNFAVVSVSRREHLCKVLATRLGRDDVCAITPTIEALATSLPTAAWPRGSAVPAMPTEPSLFYAAGEKSMCKDIAQSTVNGQNSPLQSADMDGSLAFIVETLMGVLPSDPRHPAVTELMTQHIKQVAAVESDQAEQLRSAFVVACTSPFVTSTDL